MAAPPSAARPSTAGAETSRSAVGVLQVGQGSGWPSMARDWRCSNTVPHAAHRKSYRGIADPLERARRRAALVALPIVLVCTRTVAPLVVQVNRRRVDAEP